MVGWLASNQLGRSLLFNEDTMSDEIIAIEALIKHDKMLIKVTTTDASNQRVYDEQKEYLQEKIAEYKCKLCELEDRHSNSEKIIADAYDRIHSHCRKLKLAKHSDKILKLKQLAKELQDAMPVEKS